MEGKIPDRAPPGSVLLEDLALTVPIVREEEGWGVRPD
jgi:hypothetical protein